MEETKPYQKQIWYRITELGMVKNPNRLIMFKTKVKGQNWSKQYLKMWFLPPRKHIKSQLEI